MHMLQGTSFTVLTEVFFFIIPIICDLVNLFLSPEMFHTVSREVFVPLLVILKEKIPDAITSLHHLDVKPLILEIIAPTETFGPFPGRATHAKERLSPADGTVQWFAGRASWKRCYIVAEGDRKMASVCSSGHMLARLQHSRRWTVLYICP